MPKTILIVEDEEFLRQLMVRNLTKNGYVVFEAIDGETGVEKVKKLKPDLVLLDIILPGIDGFEVLSKIKNDLDLALIPVIILSNLGQKQEIKKGLEMGAKDFLIKASFTPKEIIDKIKVVFDPEESEQK